MSISLSPEIMKRAQEVKVFITVAFQLLETGTEVRLPSQPVAPHVAWNPLGLDGFALYIVVHDETGTDLQRWEAVIQRPWTIRSVWDFGNTPLMRHYDRIDIDVNKYITARPGGFPPRSE